MSVIDGPRPDTRDMLAVHAVFRSALGPAADVVASARGDDDRRALLRNYYDNIVSFLEVHHEGEQELVFPLLLERRPQDAAVVTRMVGQHEAVVDATDAARRALERWGTEGDDAADGAAAALGELGAQLTDHLDEEEAVILPLAADCLTLEEWGALPGHGLRNFGGDKVWLILGLIRENMDDAQRQAMLDHMPPPARDMWEHMGEAAFGELIVQVRA